MVIKGVYGQLKGRWRILLRKCENSLEYLKIMIFVCMVFYNICLDLGDIILRKLDLIFDLSIGERRDRDIIRVLLYMCQCFLLRDINY